MSTPVLTLTKMRTRFCSDEVVSTTSVSSTCTTASAPLGIGPESAEKMHFSTNKDIQKQNYLGDINK